MNNYLTTPIYPLSPEAAAVMLKEGATVRGAANPKLPGFTPGNEYKIRRMTKVFTRPNDKGGRDQGREEIVLTDDDSHGAHRFTSFPVKGYERDEHPLSEFWLTMERPVEETIGSLYDPFEYSNMFNATMDTLEFMSGFKYYPAQRDLFARMASKPFGLIASEVGTGKTLCAITLHKLKQAKRTLVIAPCGTVNGAAAHWLKEIKEFVPWESVYQLFTFDDAIKIRDLPLGIYLTYPQAFLTNGTPKRKSLRELTEGFFDMVIADEAQLFKNIKSRITQEFLKINAIRRYALTATPIHNTVADLYPLLLWLAGEHKEQLFPFHNQRQFLTHFLCTNKAGQPTHQIASPAELSALLAPFMGCIRKRDCVESLAPIEIHTRFIELDAKQQRLYARAQSYQYNRHGMANARIRSTALRQICAKPTEMNDMTVKNQLIADKLIELAGSGQQAVFVSARLAQSTAIQEALKAAKIKAGRIDGTMPAARHSDIAGKFKDGINRILIMGIKCAQGYSFPQCSHLVFGSIEWTSGAWEQALGRVWRVNSAGKVNVYVFLNSKSIEADMFARVLSKQREAGMIIK